MLQIIVFISGLVILFKGKVTLSKSKTVKGMPARMIGLLLASVLPLAVVVGVVIGVYYELQGRPVQEDDFFLIGLAIDLGILAVAVTLAFLVAAKYGKTEEEWQLAEAGEAPLGTTFGAEPVFDPNNPYSPPRG